MNPLAFNTGALNTAFTLAWCGRWRGKPCRWRAPKATCLVTMPIGCPLPIVHSVAVLAPALSRKLCTICMGVLKKDLTNTFSFACLSSETDLPAADTSAMNPLAFNTGALNTAFTLAWCGRRCGHARVHAHPLFAFVAALTLHAALTWMRW